MNGACVYNFILVYLSTNGVKVSVYQSWSSTDCVGVVLKCFLFRGVHVTADLHFYICSQRPHKDSRWKVSLETGPVYPSFIRVSQLKYL